MSIKNHSLLGDFTAEEFLKDYWQKKPCLIRRALPAYHCPVSPEELAGLACEEGVSSRLVIEKDGAHPWQVKYGPLHEDDFRHLPESHWTLLVQEVNHYYQEIAALLDHFSFIPNWRIDDVMISYAPVHGSVGPHLDSYDVFLLQGMGRRRWQINPEGYSENDFIPDMELRILGNFQAAREWILEPGDMLYLPPGIAHQGIALEPCLTLSIGFLAPARSELIHHYLEETISGTARDSRYADADLTLQEYPGEITRHSLASIRRLMRSALEDDDALNSWFVKFITAPRGRREPGEPEQVSLEAFLHLFEKHEVLYRSGDCRCAFIREQDRIALFVEGDEYTLEADSLTIATLITERSFIHLNELSDLKPGNNAMELLRDFFNRGIYYFEE